MLMHVAVLCPATNSQTESVSFAQGALSNVLGLNDQQGTMIQIIGTHGNGSRECNTKIPKLFTAPPLIQSVWYPIEDADPFTNTDLSTLLCKKIKNNLPIAA